MKIFVLCLFVLIIGIILITKYLNSASKSTHHFDITKPVFQQFLSKNLKEISGISYFEDNKVICVNDETGRLFVYDFIRQEITDTLNFNENGDYEAVEFVNQTAYVLKSNGEIIAFNVDSKSSTTFDCGHNNVQEFEGLGFDPGTNSLLLAAKEMKGDKTIFQFNLSNQELTEKFKISKNLISKNGKEGKEFKPSGIAVHPLNHQIYVLASAGKKLLVFDSNGSKLFQYNLDKDQFPQPEGICFTPSGDLIIASEGKNGRASILFFNFLSKK